ncbi:hypothetical protein V9T40_006324 [Parthenolecanium corni]|uniref:Uncharacterized protein n=1 Tax=Parthenolecanium corni TaxID=536013 RepID=A0AAN9TZ98_9HEMI
MLYPIDTIDIEYGFTKALPRFGSDKIARNTARQTVDELNSPLEIRSVADYSDKLTYNPHEIRALWPVINTQVDVQQSSNQLENEQIQASQAASSDLHSSKRHRWHFGCRSENTERDPSSNPALEIRNLKNFEDDLTLEVRQQQQPLGMQQQQPLGMQQQQPNMIPSNQQQNMPPNQPQNMPTNQQQNMPPNQQSNMMPPNQQSNMMPPNQQSNMMPPNQQSNMMPPNMMPTNMMLPNMMPPNMMPPNMMPSNQQLPQMQMQTPSMPMQPVPNNMQMHPTDGQVHGQVSLPQVPNTNMMGQPSMGYPMPYYQSMGGPVGAPNNFPPYNAYPPTGQMQLPVPQNQFTTYGPSSAYTNPGYNTPLSPSQNDMEAQIASAFLATQLSNMMRDPNTRESLLYLVSELRSFLSNPNSIPMMTAMNHRAQDVMNTPALFNQFVPQNLPHSTSTLVQIQDGTNNILDKGKAKVGRVLSFVKDLADANNRLIEGTTNDIPGLNAIAKLGTGLTTTGIGFLDGLVSPWLQPSGHGSATITTVTNPQTTMPNYHYQTRE